VRGERFPSRCSLLRQECGGGRPRRFDDPLIGPDQRPRYFRALCPRRPASPRPTATELPPPESPSRGSAPMVIPRRPPASSNRHVRVNDTEPCSGSAPIPSPGRELPSTSGVRGHMVTGPRSVRRPVSEVEFQRGDAGRGRGNSLAAAASHPHRLRRRVPSRQVHRSSSGRTNKSCRRRRDLRRRSELRRAVGCLDIPHAAQPETEQERPRP